MTSDQGIRACARAGGGACLARHTRLGVAEGIFARIRATRPIAWPNSQVGLADDILGRGAGLSAALCEHYRIQAPKRPEFIEELRRNGRGAEVPE